MLFQQKWIPFKYSTVCDLDQRQKLYRILNPPAKSKIYNDEFCSVLDHQAKDRQQPLRQGVSGLGPSHRDGARDHGGHDGVQDAEAGTNLTYALQNYPRVK